jgi:MinD-like ATPase involved in chromosome partitioning or flagellar assembly
LAGWIPSDPAALGALRRGQPLVLASPDSSLTQAIDNLAAQLLAEPQTSSRQGRRAA